MTKNQKLIVVISIMASFVAFLDSSVVNVALPAIEKDLGGGLPFQQWIVNAYLLTLGSFILIAGSLSDIFGRKRILQVGLIGFGVASILCAFSPVGLFLIISRAIQGLFGALLVPSSLALIIANFKGEGQAKAIGTWTAWTGISFLIGPLIGGILVDSFSWRYIFAINIIPIALTLILMRKLHNDKPSGDISLDIAGAVLGSTGLAAMVYALIEQSNRGISDPLIILSFVSGVILFTLFILYEKRVKNPMLPLDLFKVRNFAVGNLATTSIYAGLSVATFLLIIFIQQVGGYTALQAGLSLLPVTIIMFLFSSRFGALAGKYGPRLFMSVGPIVASLGFLLMLRIDSNVSYWTQVFPGVIVFGFGLSMTVAPLTAAVLADISQEHAGIGSAINNAISRIAGLIALAAVGLLITTELDIAGFRKGVIAMAVLLILGSLVSAIGIRNPVKERVLPTKV